jgi:predicted transcriptional regulator of viral defense system
MILDRPSTLAGYAQGLLASGRIAFDTEAALQALRINRGAFLDAAGRLQRRGHLIRLLRGFYVVVPPQFHSFGAPPPSWYIDDLMHHVGRPYYVGLLKAAELHGASHQAVMDFQVVTDKQMKPVRAGRSTITFHYRKDFSAVAAGLEERKTESGSMKIASAELTALDLLRYPHASAGLDNIATVLNELGERLDPDKLGSLARAFERSVLQRVGYLLDQLGQATAAAALHRQMPAESVAWIELDPGEIADPDFTSDPVERNERWHVVVRRTPEVDE